MENIEKNIKEIKLFLNKKTKLIAVSKTYPIENILTAYNAGQRDFGENRVQELCEKYEQLKNLDINWHLIGHLQINKIKYIINFIDYIHSVDSLKLLSEINKQAEKWNRKVKCLLEFYIAKEETKFGLNFEEAIELLESEEYKKFQNIEICGVMGMASFTDDYNLIKTEFENLKNIFENLKNKYFLNCNNFSEISMGMSNDWKLAIEIGSTMIRVGTQVFGKRTLNNK